MGMAGKRTIAPFDRDVLKVLLGAGDEVISLRRTRLAAFREELLHCQNPYREELLIEEVPRLARELERLVIINKSQG